MKDEIKFKKVGFFKSLVQFPRLWRYKRDVRGLKKKKKREFENFGQFLFTMSFLTKIVNMYFFLFFFSFGSGFGEGGVDFSR